MIPIRDANPTRRTPWVTIGLIAINVVVFFTEPLGASDAQQARYFFCNAAIPFEITHGEQLQRPAEVFGCDDKSIWFSIFYSMFLHGGFLHIAGNMLYLWVFGNNVEDQLGRVRYVLFYLGAGLAATYAQAYIDPNSTTPLVGASGAVAGVLGAYLLLFPRARVTTLVIFFFITAIQLPAVVVLGFWFVLQLFQGVAGVTGGVSDNVAYMAHVGGFVAGMLLLFLLRGSRTPSRPRYYGYS